MKEKMKYKFGHKLRSVRERKGYTLKDVAVKAEVSESLISQIERNKVSPSIDTLLLIADILDIDHEYLFDEYRQKRQVSIVRNHERGVIRRDKVAFHQLSINDEISKDSAFEAFLLEVEPEGEKGDREYGHAGMEFGVILLGSAELIYGHEKHTLHQGDSIYFPSDMPHLLKNIGEQTLQAIWVISPPRKLF